MKKCVEKVLEKKSEGYRKNNSHQNNFWPDLSMLAYFGEVTKARKMFQIYCAFLYL